jgi:thiol-disulfide isomerase/thioredoxin
LRSPVLPLLASALVFAACSRQANPPASPPPPPPAAAAADPALASVRIERLDTLEAVGQLPHPTEKPRLLHFWALWCPSCMEELPQLVTVARQAEASGAEVVMVDADGFEREADVKAHLANLGALGVGRHVLLDLGLDPERVTELFEGKWRGDLPATFVYLPSGRRAFSAIGPLRPGQDRQVLRAISP